MESSGRGEKNFLSGDLKQAARMMQNFDYLECNTSPEFCREQSRFTLRNSPEELI